jgi:hypothetical protein
MNLAAFVEHTSAAIAACDWQRKPFGHAIIEGFLPEQVARQIEPNLNAQNLGRFVYDSPIERKDASNHWNDFASELYAVFAGLNHPAIARTLVATTGIKDLFLDAGLHGGGIHRTTRGGRLNLHIDYAVHPKLGAERRLNLIIYLNRSWETSWGGQLQLWSGSEQPEHMFANIDPIWNRAVLFATGDHSWHGFPAPIQCPTGVVRQSLALYYCSLVGPHTTKRHKAKFVPAPEQRGNAAIQQLCDRRMDAELASEAYRS